MFKRLKGRELWWGEESAQLGGGLDWIELAVEHSWVHNKSRKWFHYTEDALCIMGPVPRDTIKY